MIPDISQFRTTGDAQTVAVKNKVLKKLKREGYGLRTTWRPLHSLEIYKNCPRDKMENSNDFFKRAINFPSSPKLNY